MAKKAIIAGASGLIGSNLLGLILKHQGFSEVLVLVRELLPLQHPKLRQIKVSFDTMEQYSDLIQGDAVFCCLGSTIKKTPDKTEYRKVDFDYPLKLAQIAKKNDIHEYHLISSLGANKNSVFFYCRLKGEIEEAIKSVGLKSVHFYRPALLTGQRQEHRPSEKPLIKLMNLLNPLLIGNFKKYRSIKGEFVARAMLNQSLKPLTGLYIYESNKIMEMA